MDDKLKKLTEKKKQLDKLRPLPPELVTNLEEWFKVELTYSSNAIEGNTLSRIETAEVIERGVKAVKRSLDANINAGKGKSIMSSLSPTPISGKLLKIGGLAKIAGETIHTLRFWTGEDLLQVKSYTKGGYQLYEPLMVERIKKIRQLQKEERLTIAEIKERLKNN